MAFQIDVARSNVTAAQVELKIFGSSDQQQVEFILKQMAALEEGVWQSHQKLEEISINASALRYSLSNLKNNISLEVEDAVREVKTSNEDLKARLKAQISSAQKESNTYKAMQEMFKAHIAILRSENSELMERVKNAEWNLNKKLTEKAAHLQLLGETKQKISELNQEMSAVEETTSILKSELTQKNQEQKEKQKGIKVEIESVSQETREHEKELLTKQNEAHDLGAEVVARKQEIEEKRRYLHQLTCKEEELKENEETLRKQCSHLRSTIQSLECDSQHMQAKQCKSAKEFNLLMHELSEQILKIMSETKSEESKASKWIAENERLETEVKISANGLQVQLGKVDDAQSRLRGVKDTLLYQAEDAARMSREIKDMERKLSQLNDSHRAKSQVFKSQVEDLSAKLAMDKEDRQKSQMALSEFQENSASERVRNDQILQALSQELQDTQRKNEILILMEGESKTSIEILRGRSEQCEKEWTDMATEYRDRIEKYETQKKQMEEDYALWEEKMARSKAQLDLLQPIHEDLSQKLANMQKKYEEMRKKAVERKSQEMNIRKDLKHKVQMYEDNIHQKKLLQRALASSRVQSSSILRQCSTEANLSQDSIAASELKLEAILHENDRLTQKILALTKEEDELEKMRTALSEKVAIETKEVTSPSFINEQPSCTSFGQTTKKTDVLHKLSELYRQCGERTQWLCKTLKESRIVEFKF